LTESQLLYTLIIIIYYHPIPTLTGLQEISISIKIIFDQLSVREDKATARIIIIIFVSCGKVFVLPSARVDTLRLEQVYSLYTLL